MISEKKEEEIRPCRFVMNFTKKNYDTEKMLHSCSTANIWLHLPLRKFADYKSFILEDNNFFFVKHGPGPTIRSKTTTAHTQYMSQLTTSCI